MLYYKRKILIARINAWIEIPQIGRVVVIKNFRIKEYKKVLAKKQSNFFGSTIKKNTFNYNKI